MAQFFKILTADPLGEPWTPRAPGAKPVQNWWCQVEGQDKAVSIGKQVGNDLRPGQHVYGDLKFAVSQKGNEYWKFDGQQVPDDVQRPTDDPSSPAQATAQQATNMSAAQPDWFKPWGNLLTQIAKDVRDLKGTDEPDTLAAPTQPEPVELDEVTKAKLDDIFGKDEPKDTPEGV